MGKPHAIVIPYPAQGHVIPMLELSQLLESNGVKVTFVNSEFNHQRILKSLLASDNQQLAELASIPDGLEPWEDRNDVKKVAESVYRVMPGELEAFIERINGSQGNKITCIVADLCAGWAFEVAEKLGLRSAAFWPATAATLAAASSIPKLLSDRIIDNDGKALSNQGFPLFHDMPEMNSTNILWWSIFPDKATAKVIYDTIAVKAYHLSKSAELIICNSSPQLELEVFSQFPNIIPIGPILASNRLGKAVGHFWEEESACLSWLDQQAPNSVVYIAFGSFTVFDQTQFEELAMGLELMNMPFLWVVRENLAADTNMYPSGFKERVKNRGQMVGWAPQQQVLSHPSVAIFISHCGWNSTIEGVANGVPFLCWPYFADQIANQAYISDVWKIGLRFSKDESGIIRSGEIKDKVEQLLRDKSYKERAMNLQAKTIASVKEGCSLKNLKNFIEWIKKN